MTLIDVAGIAILILLIISGISMYKCVMHDFIEDDDDFIGYYGNLEEEKFK